MKYYSIPDITKAYKISKSTLKKKIKAKELNAIILHTCWTNESMIKYVIPESELVKLEYCKEQEPIAGEMSQPEYYENYEHIAKKRALFNALRKAEHEAEYIESYRAFIENYQEYLCSEEWKCKRQARLRLDDFRCKRCGTGKNLVVHHINYDHIGTDKEIDDLVTLCKSCHSEVHTKDLYEEKKGIEKNVCNK